MAQTTQEEAPIHLTIIGGGSAGCAAALWAADHGARVTLVNAGLPLGGNAINVGVFPARIFMQAATARRRTAPPFTPGQTGVCTEVDLNALSHHVTHSIEVARRALVQSLQRRPGLELIDGYARFIDAHTLEVDGKRWQCDRTLLTCGASSSPPEIDGIEGAGVWRLQDLVNCNELPESILMLGTSDLGLTYAQAFARLGSKVTLLSERERFLDPEHGERWEALLRDALRDDQVILEPDCTVTHLERKNGQARALGTRRGAPTHWSAAQVVVVDHRHPSTDRLALHAADVETDAQGFIQVDESFRTSHPLIYAAGDVVGPGRHTHAAVQDAILAAHNAVLPTRTAGHTHTAPFVIPTDPSFAGVGWNQAQAQAAGFDAECLSLDLSTHPLGPPTGAPQGLIELICDRRSNHLLGARLAAPGAADAIMELALAVRYGLPVDELATLVHPPATLSEAIAVCARHRRR
ncbi:FAD-dependent oxidoreductase [Lujinxingia litoralis]|uniref:FAD-dependent oxidoreductase n=1 Tax=Lujinxingia litoralis TaxID=2211119 RepID=UPI001313E292|nr:FAD-dependent oxidoreductase [Lujinxingia litoralis]